MNHLESARVDAARAAYASARISADASPSGRQPVFNAQSGHARKLAQVVGHQHRTETDGMPGDEHVERADQFAGA